MLTYKRIFTNDYESIYQYFPEGDQSAPGKIRFVANESPEVIEESSLDFQKYYANHAIHGIDTTQESGTIAWF